MPNSTTTASQNQATLCLLPPRGRSTLPLGCSSNVGQCVSPAPTGELPAEKRAGETHCPTFRHLRQPGRVARRQPVVGRGERGATTGLTHELQCTSERCQRPPCLFGSLFRCLLRRTWSGIPTGCKRIVAREPVVVPPATLE